MATPTAAGIKYQVNIEGTVHKWDSPTISVTEIRNLGGLPANMPVLLIDLKTNEQRQLAEDDVVDLRPGMGFARKYEFRRA